MLLSKTFIIVVFFLTVAFADVEEESGVLVLTDENFDDVIGAHDDILVEFYAPWCTHCKALAPEYAKAAQSLQSSESKVKLAKLDATVETKMAAKFEIRGYPTLKFFRKGKPTEYNGGRTSEEMVKWLNKKIGPTIAAITSAEECDELSDKHDFHVIVLSEDTSSSDYKVIEETADSLEFSFFHCTHPTIMKKYGLKKGAAIIVKRNFDEPSITYDGEINVDDVSKFLKRAYIPVVTEFTEEAASKIFGSETKTHFIAFMRKSDSHYGSYKQVIADVAVDFREKCHAVIIDVDVENHKRILEFFGISEDETPTYRLIELHDTAVKYKPAAALFTADTIREFLSDVFSRKIDPYLQSEEIPADWDKGSVKVLVGKNFDAVARDSSKAVFVEFYAPWCGHCKQLMPIWEQLGDEYESRSDIIIAKMDATANEIVDIKIGSFPTIKFFPKNTNEVIDYSGDRTLDAFKQFIASHTEAQAEDTEAKDVKEEL